MNLKELLGEELYNQVMEKVSGDLELLVNNKKESTYVPKSRLDTAVEQKQVLSNKIDELEIKMQEMQNDVSNVDTLKNQLKEAQGEITKAKEEAINIKKDSEIKFAIADSGAIRKELVAKLLDSSKIKIKDDGSIEGINEQIESLKTEAPELFKSPTPSQGNNSNQDGGNNGANNNGASNNNSNNNPNQNQQPPLGGTGNPGNGSKGNGGKVETIGERLAKRKAESKVQVDYFK